MFRFKFSLKNLNCFSPLCGFFATLTVTLSLYFCPFFLRSSLSNKLTFKWTIELNWVCLSVFVLWEVSASPLSQVVPDKILYQLKYVVPRVENHWVKAWAAAAAVLIGETPWLVRESEETLPTFSPWASLFSNALTQQNFDSFFLLECEKVFIFQLRTKCTSRANCPAAWVAKIKFFYLCKRFLAKTMSLSSQTFFSISRGKPLTTLEMSYRSNGT